MLQAFGSLLALAVLIGAGIALARIGLLDHRAVDGLKLLITRLTLPLLLLRAFLQLEPQARNLALAAVVFLACAAMAGIGAALARLAHLPSPETRLLFQGFEAGMLGYALFVALHTDAHLPALAAVDLGQVVYVFTALMVQLSVLERRSRTDGSQLGAARFPWRDLAASPVLWAIALGLLLAGFAPATAHWLTAADGPAAAVFDTVGGLTTPLVCLVIGASLAAGVPRDPAIVLVVAARTAVGLALGLLVAFVVVPRLGFDSWHARAAVVLFTLPAPFVIPAYYRGRPAFVSAVLTLGTAVSVTLIAVLAVAGLA